MVGAEVLISLAGQKLEGRVRCWPRLDGQMEHGVCGGALNARLGG